MDAHAYREQQDQADQRQRVHTSQDRRIAIQEDHGHRQQNSIQDVRIKRWGLVELHSMKRGCFQDSCAVGEARGVPFGYEDDHLRCGAARLQKAPL